MAAPFHLAAFSASLNTATLTKVTPATDQFLQAVVNTNFYALPRGYNKILAHAGIGATITRQRIDASSLYPVLPEFECLNVGAEPGNPPALNQKWESPLEVNDGDAVGVDSANAAGGAEQNHALLWIGTKGVPLGPRVQTRPLRCTGAATLTANAWTNVPLTFTYQPRPGTYGIYGMYARSAGAIAARVVPTDGGPRPGVIGADAAADLPAVDDPFRAGRLATEGPWATFTDLVPPTVEFFAVSADTAEVVIFDVRKIAERQNVAVMGGANPRQIA